MASDPIAELGRRAWREDLEVTEHAGTGKLMFPADLRRRNAKGEVVVVPVRVRVPSPLDTIQARPEAIAWAVELKIQRDGADKDVFEQLEQLCLLARSIRTADTGAQYASAQELAEHDEASLHDIQEQLNAFKAALDPRPSLLTEAEVWRAIAAVAREASIDPLAGLAGREQPILVVRMALEACRSPTGQRWLQSFGISIPALPPSPTTEPS